MPADVASGSADPIDLSFVARSKSYPDDLRDRLIAEASARLKHESVEHMSLRELAASVGASTNAIYSIFGGKDALVAEVVHAAQEEFVQRQQVHLAAPPTVEALMASGRTYRNWAREHPALYRLIFSGAPERGAGVGTTDAVLQPLRDLLLRLMAAGVVRRLELEPLCLSVWAATHGYVLLELDRWPEESPDAEARFNLHLATVGYGYLMPDARRQLRAP